MPDDTRGPGCPYDNTLDLGAFGHYPHLEAPKTQVVGKPVAPIQAQPRFKKRTGKWRDTDGKEVPLPFDTTSPSPPGHRADDNTNPKDLIGQTKPGLRSIPPVALLEEGVIMQDGAESTGPSTGGTVRFRRRFIMTQSCATCWPGTRARTSIPAPSAGACTSPQCAPAAAS